MAKQPMCPAVKPRVAGSIPDRDKYFHFGFLACFPSLRIGGAFLQMKSCMTIHLLSVVDTPEMMKHTRPCILEVAV